MEITAIVLIITMTDLPTEGFDPEGSGAFYQVVTSHLTALPVMRDGDIPGVHISDDKATASEGGGHGS